MPRCVRQMRRQPALTLSQCLGVGINCLDALHGIGQPQQVVPHHQAGFANDVKWRVQEKVKRTRNDALGGVFNCDHAVTRTAGSGGAKHLINGCARHVLNTGAKKLQCSLLAEGARRPQISDPHGRLQGQAGRHDFTPHRGDMLIFQWPGIALLDLFDHLGHAVRPQEGRAFPLF